MKAIIAWWAFIAILIAVASSIFELITWVIRKIMVVNRFGL